jgi:hypothetical protein
MDIGRRIERLERVSYNSRPTGNCGKGLKLEKGTPALWCSRHGYECWLRDNPVDYAKAAMLLEAIHRREPEPDVSNPPLELVEECRRLLLEQGCELQEEESEGSLPG